MCAGVCVDTHTPTLTYIFLFLLKVKDKTQKKKWQGSDLWIKNANASFELGLLTAVSTLASILGKPVFFFPLKAQRSPDVPGVLDSVPDPFAISKRTLGHVPTLSWAPPPVPQWL